MLWGLVEGIFVAWLLTQCGADAYFITFVKEVFHTTVSVGTFYVTIAILGALGGSVYYR